MSISTVKQTIIDMATGLLRLPNLRYVLIQILETTASRGVGSPDTGNTTIDDSKYQWNANTTSGAITYTLPAGVANKEYKIVNAGTGGNALTITPDGSELLLGANSSFTLSDGESLVIAYDTTVGWY